MLYEQKERFVQQTKYQFYKMVHLLLNASTSFSLVLLQLTTACGFVPADISLLSILVTACLRIFTRAISGPTPTLILGNLRFMTYWSRVRLSQRSADSLTLLVVDVTIRH